MKTIDRPLIVSWVGLVSIALLSLNTWVLKPFFSGVISGKLSDITGVLVLALVIDAVASFVWKSERRLTVACVVSGVYFLAIKTTLFGTELNQWVVDTSYRLVGQTAHYTLQQDPTDLIALLALPPLVWYGRSRE